MASSPLNVLKKGLKTLYEQFKAKKGQLQAQLAEGKSISSQDERWLDGEANLVDEERVLEVLKRASNYEQGLEAHAIEEATDEDICKAVLNTQKAREDAVINGGDDIDTDNALCAEAPPTYREVLEAAAVINKYVCSLDSALAHELEAKLAMLSRQIHWQESHNLTTTHITNYFPHA